MTKVQEIGITISVSEPLVAGAAFLDTLQDNVNDYQHTISAVGGYDSASFTLGGSTSRLEDWLERGLGRHVVTYNDAGVVIWEGFVNKVSYSVGGRRIERGPLMEVCNRVVATYSPLDTSVDPPVRGATTYTTLVEDATSQGRYGILKDLISVGDTDQTTAEEIRDAYLLERKYAQTDQQVTLLQSGDTPLLQVECLGYYHWLDRFVYEDTTNATTTVSAKLQLVLAAEPNGFISTNYAGIASNAYAVNRKEDQQPTGWAVIKYLTSIGGSGAVRYLFGVYRDRRAYYNAIPTEVSYQYSLSSGQPEVQNLTGLRVRPWDVLPGRWMFHTDLLVGRNQSSVLRTDPRNMFIESVTYTAPYGLQLSGGKIDTISQRLARLGVGGI